MAYKPLSEAVTEDIALSEDQGTKTEDAEIPAASCCSNSYVRNANKNVYGLAFCFFANSCANLGLQNIQSSVNKDAGLGLVSLSVLYVAYMASAICTVGIVKSFGTRYTVIFGLVGYLFYMALNYYPSWYTLIPGSVMAGLGTGPIWIAGNCHVIAIAERMAPILNERKDVLIAKYIGVLYLAYQLSTPPGNIASSLIFLFAESYGNSSATEGCNLLSSLNIEPLYFYILVSLYVLIQVISIIVAFLVIDNTVSVPSTLVGKVKALVTPSTIKKVFNVKMLLLAPIGFYCGLELSFPSGTFAQVYISDCLGVSKVGFILMLFGIAAGALSFIIGSIKKYVPECLVLPFASILQVGLLVFLLLWEREPSYAAVILFVIGWGFGDTIWQITYSGYVAYLFPGDTVPAFGASRLWIGLGFTVGFLSSYLSGRQVYVVLYLLLAVNIVATIFYIIILSTTKRMEQVFLYSVYCPKRVSCSTNGDTAVSNEEMDSPHIEMNSSHIEMNSSHTEMNSSNATPVPPDEANDITESETKV